MIVIQEKAYVSERVFAILQSHASGKNARRENVRRREKRREKILEGNAWEENIREEDERSKVGWGEKVWEEDTRGEVLLCTSKGIYIRLGRRILQLTSSEYGCTPLGIGLENREALRPLLLQEGQSIRTFFASVGTLHFPRGRLELELAVKPSIWAGPLSLSPGRVRDCARLLGRRVREPGEKGILRGVSALCFPLLLGEQETFVLRGNLYCRVAYPMLKELHRAMRTAQEAQIRDMVRQLLGLGIGLTPSLDDVLSGMLYTLLRVAPENPATVFFKSAIVSFAPERTNEISAAYLLAVAEGGDFDLLDTILLGLSGRQPVEIEPILGIGNSSGSEMLLGALLAVDIVDCF